MHRNNQTSLCGINESFAEKGWARFKIRISVRVPLKLTPFYFKKLFDN